MTQEIGDRYLRRTIGETQRLRELLGDARRGDTAALVEILQMAHKVHGSGAMFGFDVISGAAERLQRFVEAYVTAGQPAGSDFLRQCEHLIKNLEAEVHKAALAQGLL
ncbi:MAG: Hpt domain-containing protein [Steroidobacter sp.]